METFNFVMTGAIVPDHCPLATAPIRPDREYDMSIKYVQGDSKTARLPRMATFHQETVQGERISQTVYLPYFPAAGFRAALRRSARDEIAARVGSSGWSLYLHRLMTIGGAMSSGSETDIDITAISNFRDKNPLISLFGCASGKGHGWVEGKLSVGHLIPDTYFVPQIITGVRTDPMRRNPCELVMLDPAAAAAINAVSNAARTVSKLKAGRADLAAQVKAAKKSKADCTELEQAIADIDVTIAEASELAGGDVSVQMPLSGYEVIPPETQLNSRISGRNLTLGEFGLFVRALRLFAQHPLLGAHHAHGCGFVRGRWEVRINRMTGSFEFLPFGEVVILGDDLIKLVSSAESAHDQGMAGVTENALLPVA